MLPLCLRFVCRRMRYSDNRPKLCCRVGIPVVLLLCVCVCVSAPADDLLMTNGWNEPEEPSMGSHPCEVKCKIDI